MKCLIKNSRPLLALLLLLQATTVYALPADIHLNLCFGSDGHLEISTDFCAETSLNEQFQLLNPDFSAEDHHDDCLDIVLDCDEEVLFFSTEETLLAKTEIEVSSLPIEAEEPVNYLSYQVNQSPLPNSHLIKRPPSPAHLGVISTTVLLI